MERAGHVAVERAPAELAQVGVHRRDVGTDDLDAVDQRVLDHVGEVDVHVAVAGDVVRLHRAALVTHVGDDVVVGQPRRPVDRDVEDALADARGAGAPVGEVEPHLQRGPGWRREVPLQLRVAVRVPAFGVEDRRRRARRNGAVDRGARAPAGRVAGGVAVRAGGVGVGGPVRAGNGRRNRAATGVHPVEHRRIGRDHDLAGLVHVARQRAGAPRRNEGAARERHQRDPRPVGEVADPVGVAGDPETLRGGEHVQHADALGPAGVPAERQAVGRVERRDALAGRPRPVRRCHRRAGCSPSACARRRRPRCR